MKKLLFSAVALVAFSFAGMANNGVKEVETKETKKEETLKEKDLWDCVLLAGEVYAKLKKNFSEDEAAENAVAYYEDCVKDL